MLQHFQFPAAQLPERVASTVDVRDPRTRSFGHIDAASMDPAEQTQDRLAVSASMRTALLVYSGITVKMMITASFVSYSPTSLARKYSG